MCNRRFSRLSLQSQSSYPSQVTKAVGTANTMKHLWRVLILFIIVFCADAEPSPMPSKYTGTWAGSTGTSQVNLIIHGGMKGSVVGSATDKIGYRVCQYELVYDADETDGGVLGLMSGKLLLGDSRCVNTIHNAQTLGTGKLVIDMQTNVEKGEGQEAELGPIVSLVLVSPTSF